MPIVRTRLNDRLVAALPPQQPDSPSTVKEYPDAEVVGLRLAVGKSGRKFWDFRYTLRRRKCIYRLGEFPGLTTPEARKLAWHARAAILRGVDPARDRALQKAVPTLAEFFPTYLEHARRAIKSAADSERRLRLWVLPEFGRRQLDDIRRNEIESYHLRLLDKMPPASANRILACWKAMHTYAVKIEQLDRSPAERVKPHTENNARERCLSGDELRRYLAALDEEPNVYLRSLLRLLLACGARRRELLTAMWSDCQLERKTLLLPNTKAGKARHILLNDVAVEILRTLPRKPGNPYIFPGRAEGTALQDPKKAHARACARAGIKDLKIHDLRHSFASLAVSGGASLFVVQKLLGHASPTMSQRYSHLASDTVRAGSQQVADALKAASNPPPKTDATKTETAA